MPKITKTASGKYHAQILVGYDTHGKRIIKSITAPTVKEVKARIAQALTEESYTDMTVGEAYKRYIDSKSNTLSPSTLREYRAAAERDFPELRRIKLSKITSQAVQIAVNDISAKNSPKTVRNKYCLLEAVLKDYRPDLRLKVRLPQKQVKEEYIPTEEDIYRLIEAADPQLRIPIMLGAFAGLRRSEVCALTPDDFSDHDVYISKAKVQGEGGFVIKPPKSEKGYRHIPLDPDLIARVLEWEHFGMSPNTLNNQFRRLCKSLGLPIHFHLLRHFYCTMLINNGLSFKNAMSYGGWNSVKMVENVYGHANRNKTLDDKVVNIFSKYTKSSAG